VIPKITQKKLDQLAAQYGDTLLKDIREVLGQPQYRNKGELFESLRLSLSNATDSEPPVILLEYADQGFYLGYKSPKWVKLPNIEKLKEWAATKVFRTIPGYESGTSSIPEFKKRERVAWAIAWNQRKNDAWRQRKWKNEAGLGSLLQKLNSDTIQAYAKDVEKLLADAISQGTPAS
jgi:hypothetical protein